MQEEQTCNSVTFVHMHVTLLHYDGHEVRVEDLGDVSNERGLRPERAWGVRAAGLPVQPRSSQLMSSAMNRITLGRVAAGAMASAAEGETETSSRAAQNSPARTRGRPGRTVGCIAGLFLLGRALSNSIRRDGPFFWGRRVF